jgi:hypothetical protein
VWGWVVSGSFAQGSEHWHGDMARKFPRPQRTPKEAIAATAGDNTLSPEMRPQPFTFIFH